MGDVRVVPDRVGVFDGEDAAAAYAGLDEVLWGPIATATLLRSQPRLGERVLDACAGIGASALPTAELVGPEGTVDAVEAAAPLLEVLRDRAGDRLPQLRTHVHDTTTWPEGDYDLVQCVLGVLYFGEPEAGVGHLVERARPGGRVAVTSWAAGALDVVGEALGEALPADDDRVPEFAGRGRAVLVGAETPGSYAHWLSGCGLAGVRADVVPRHLELTPDLAWRLVLGTGFRAFVADLDDEARDDVRERLTAALEARGTTTVDLTALIAVGHRPEE